MIWRVAEICQRHIKMGIVSSYFVKDADKSGEEEAAQETKKRDEATPALHTDTPRVSNLTKNLRARQKTRRNQKKNK